MGLVTTHPRLEDPGVEPVSLLRDGRPPGRFAPIILLFAVPPAVIAAADDRLGLRLVMASLVIVVCAAAVVAVVRSRTMTTGVVRFHDSSHSLWLRPPASPSVAVVVLLFVLLLPAVAQGATDILGLETMPSVVVRRGPYLLAALAAGGLVVMLWRLRRAPGIEMTPSGIHGIRGVGPVHWRWDEVGEVTVEPGRVARLGLAHAEGSPVFAVPFLMLGSDPQRAAALLRFYKDNPTERPLLAEGGAEAVRRANDVLRARQDGKG